MKSTLALASIVLSLSSSSSFSPFTHAAPHPQSSPFQDISSSSSSSPSDNPKVLLTISTLNPSNTQKRISHKIIPIPLSGDGYGSYLEGFVNLPTPADDDNINNINNINNDDDDDESSSWSSSSSSLGLDLRLSSISFTSTGDVDSPICSFRIAGDADTTTTSTSTTSDYDDAAAAAADINNVMDIGNNNNDEFSSFRANVNPRNKWFYGKPFPGGDGRSIMGNQISGGSDRKVNGVYCIAANKNWGGGGDDDYVTSSADGLDDDYDDGYDDDDNNEEDELAAADLDLDLDLDDEFDGGMAADAGAGADVGGSDTAA